MPLNLDALIARLPGRRRKAKYEQIEQATAAPGEVRIIECGPVMFPVNEHTWVEER